MSNQEKTTTETSVVSEEKKKLTPRQIFWIRFVFWTLFACVLPVGFIIWRFELFQKVSAVSIGGWGLIAIVIAMVFIISLIKYVRKGMKQGMLKQILSGIISIIAPLVGLLLILNAIKDSIDLFEQVLIVVILCEMVGIPLNPMPAWLEARRKEQRLEEAESLSDVLLDKFFDRKKNEEKK